MSIFRRGEPLAGPRGRRFKIRITTEDGRVLHWRKRGGVHTVEEDVADIFVARFNRELFQALPDGTLTSPVPGETLPIAKVEKEPADDDS
jgi:hypothetical protein